MSDNQLNVVVICGSLRQASYNASLARTLPALAPPGMVLKAAPGWDKMPVYNHDLHADGKFPAEVTAWGNSIRAADGVIIVSPEYNWTIPGGLKNAIDWVSRFKEVPFKEKPVALQSCAGGALGGCAHAISSAPVPDFDRRADIRQAGNLRLVLGEEIRRERRLN